MFYKKSNTNIIAININDNNIKGLLVDEKLTVIACKEIAIEQNIIVNGIIQNKESFILKLKELIDSLCGINFEKDKKSIKCYLNLPQSQEFIYNFHLPLTITKENIEKEIITEVQKVIPFNITELDFSYFIKEETAVQSVLFVSAKKNIIEDYKNIFKNYGLNLAVIDIESCSLARALIDFRNLKDSVCIININQTAIHLSIFQKTGIIIFSTSIPIAMNDTNRTKITDEIKKIIAYCEKQYNEKITNIIITGENDLIQSSNDFFSKNLTINCFVVDSWKSIKSKNVIEKSLSFANVIGLALWDVSQIAPKINLIVLDQIFLQCTFCGTVLRFVKRNMKKLLIFIIFVIFILSIIYFKFFT